METTSNDDAGDKGDDDAKQRRGGGGGGDGVGPPYASRAMSLVEPDWSEIGKARSPSDGGDGKDDETKKKMSLDDVVDDLTSLLLARLEAVAAPLGTYPDLSVKSVCEAATRRKNKDWPHLTLQEKQKQEDGEEGGKVASGTSADDVVVAETREFVSRIVKGYKDVPYHNMEHAHHVVLSTCKLLDMILLARSSSGNNTGNSGPSSPGGRMMHQQHQQHNHHPPSYGLRNDPLLLFVQVFAALIHDVEHQGLANRQLASERDRLAILYNDQSVAENWSLYVAFSEFLQDDFRNLRKVLFESNSDLPGAESHDEAYARFRKAVINLVLSTDIASPERTQIGKSKWKEAFGDPFETVERKLRVAEQQQQQREAASGGAVIRRRSLLTGREFKIPAGAVPLPMNRRGTAQTGVSELSSRDGMAADGGGGDEEDSLSATPEGSLHGEDRDRDHHDHLHQSHHRNNKEESISNIDDDMSGDGMSGDGISGGRVNFSPLPAGGGGSSAAAKPGVGAEMAAAAAAASSAGNDADGAAGGCCGRSASSGSMGNVGNNSSRWERRMSATSRHSAMSSRYRQRLGILRTVDLSGETLENYSVSGGSRCHLASLCGASASVASEYAVELDADEPDTLKAEVLQETIMTAADVAHNLQGWSQMTKWSNRLYLELRKAHVAGRGFNAQPRWFENQIGFLESYLLPLAHRLEDTGVFPLDVEFAKIVEDNRDRWLTEGYDVAQEIIQKGAEVYPENGGCGGGDS